MTLMDESAKRVMELLAKSELTPGELKEFIYPIYDVLDTEPTKPEEYDGQVSLPPDRPVVILTPH